MLFKKDRDERMKRSTGVWKESIGLLITKTVESGRKKRTVRGYRRRK